MQLNSIKIKSVLDKLSDIKKSLNSGFLERKEVIDMIILAIISQKHSILIGGPGLAKTAILKSLVRRIHGLKLFDFQMTPSTDINELISRNIKNKIGIDNCDIALIDEFFKAPYVTLNSLLAIMNERIIYDPEPRKIPLVSLFATSNEKPDKSSDAGLLPLYDRFLFRKEILPVRSKENFKKLLELKDELKSYETSLNREDINILISASDMINIPDRIFDALYEIREALMCKQVFVSDRRWKEAVKILRVSALLERRDAVCEGDIRILESSLWTYYSDIRAVKNIVGRELH